MITPSLRRLINQLENDQALKFDDQSIIPNSGWAWKYARQNHIISQSDLTIYRRTDAPIDQDDEIDLRRIAHRADYNVYIDRNSIKFESQL